jgi:hypothetical protein
MVVHALTAVPPLQDEAALDPAVRYEAGARAISGIVASTEREVAGMIERAAREREAATAHVRLRVREHTAGDRLRLASLRHELTGQRDAVATGFDALLGLLDEADRRLAFNDGGPGIARELARPALSAPATASQRDGVSSPPEPAQGPTRPASAAARRRWWHRWVRPAA